MASRVLIFFFVLFVSIANASEKGGPMILESAKTSPTLLELYTSQGCYSCPPAEVWINKFSGRDKLWKELIPINLHIDYWDYLGWKDPFSRPEFSQRQRLYKRFSHTPNVATPGFVVNGKGWNGWFRGQSLPSTPLAGKGKLSANIDGTDITVRFLPIENRYRAPHVHVAVLGFGIETDIPKGENAGKTLAHDFVVVGYHKERLNAKSDAWESWVYRPHTVNVDMDKQAIAIWITEKDDPYPLQAVAGWL